MPRLPLARILFACLATLVALGAPAAAPRPNIVVILSDDMGFSDIGCYGGEIATPNLDNLAAQGLRFTQFYNTARCCPTRAALLTGLYSHQAGVGHMVEDKGLDGYRGNLNRSSVTIAEALRPAGYGTYMVGKYHVTNQFKPDGAKDNWPTSRGFDRFYGMITGGGNFFDPAMLTRDTTMITPVNDREYQPRPGEPYYFTDAIADNAVRYIADHHKAAPDKPFFMYVAFTAAHWPMHAKEADIAKYKGKYDGGYGPVRAARFERLKKLGLIKPDWKMTDQAGDWDKVADKAWEARCMEVYAAMVDCLDQNIGKVVAELRRTGQLDNTLILFLQDNGGCAETVGRGTPKDERLAGKTRPDKPTFAPMAPTDLQLQVIPKQARDGFPVRQGVGVMPGPYDTYIAYGQGWANVSNTPFREYKHWEHEGGISTPLIAHWPSGITRKGELEHQPGHLIDIMATCVDLAGAQYPKTFNGHAITPLEGKSLAPAFAGKPIDREAIYWEHEGNRAVRMGKWKLVAKGPAGKWELYDMDADRPETNDLAEKEPDRVKDMVAKWEAWAKRAKVLPWIWTPQYGEKEDTADAAGGAKRLFELKQGDDLSGRAAPRIAGRTFAVTARVERWGDGVIVAQGGVAHGFSLYVKDGLPVLGVRIANTLHTAAAKDKPAAPGTLTATIARDGALTLALDGKTLASAKAPSAVAKHPVDGLQVGQDLKGAVGDYDSPNPFTGQLGPVTVELKD